ncbi:hypothetical protein [Dongshaea marina]|uniref:hypothetical protein n=1 Tax=Dongshaea marina TaxID=2047966 RepID=UPI000D3ECE5B|nr:hypothetical protein [Dongshaea marina]
MKNLTARGEKLRREASGFLHYDPLIPHERLGLSRVSGDYKSALKMTIDFPGKTTKELQEETRVTNVPQITFTAKRDLAKVGLVSIKVGFDGPSHVFCCYLVPIEYAPEFVKKVLNFGGKVQVRVFGTRFKDYMSVEDIYRSIICDQDENTQDDADEAREKANAIIEIATAKFRKRLLQKVPALKDALEGRLPQVQTEKH